MNNRTIVDNRELVYQRFLLLTCPTGSFCREDRCQSYFHIDLIPTRRAPLEDCEAAGALRAVGAMCSILDASSEGLSTDDILAAISRVSPEIIVVVCTFGSLHADLTWCEKLARSFPDALIGLRGAPCFTWAKDLLTSSAVLDFCLHGEYELTFNHIARFGIDTAPGLTFVNTEKEVVQNPAILADDLDVLPFPDRSSIKPELYTVKGIGSPQYTIRVQRGCPFPCSYCLVQTVSGTKARHRSPRSIVAEIESLITLGARYFYFRADTFSLKKSWVLELCAELSTLKEPIHWVTTTRVDCVDEEVIAAMRQAGCYGISFGVDVASEKISAFVGKYSKVEDAHAAMRLCDTYGIISLAYIMIGFVWETHETLKESANFIQAVAPDLLTVHFAHPYPGTRYHSVVKESSINVTSHFAQAEPAHACPGLSQAELNSAAQTMLKRQRRRIGRSLSLMRKIFPHVLRERTPIARW